MKKLLGLLLAMLMTCSLGIPVFAGFVGDNAFFSQSAKYLHITSATTPEWTYDDAVNMKYQTYIAGTYTEAGLYGELYFRKEKDRYRELDARSDTTVGEFLEIYGNDMLIVGYREERFAVFPEQENTLYPIGQFLGEEVTDPVAYPYTLTEYIKAMTFLEWQMSVDKEHFGSLAAKGMSDELVAAAEEYWLQYRAKQQAEEQTKEMLVIVSVAVLIIGLGTLLFVLGKKGKLKVNNDFINRIWVPALKKWKN